MQADRDQQQEFIQEIRKQNKQLAVMCDLLKKVGRGFLPTHEMPAHASSAGMKVLSEHPVRENSEE